MKKLFFVLAIGAFAACNNNSATDAKASDSAGVKMDSSAKTMDSASKTMDSASKMVDSAAKKVDSAAKH